MEQASWHTFQVLTKRSSLMRDFLRRRYARARRRTHLAWRFRREGKQVFAHSSSPRGTRRRSLPFRRASYWPHRQIDLTGLIGSLLAVKAAPAPRPCIPDWVRDIRDQCAPRRRGLLLQAMGGLRPKSGGRQLDGREWNQYPTSTPPLPLPPNQQPRQQGHPWVHGPEKLDALGRYSTTTRPSSRTRAAGFAAPFMSTPLLGPVVSRVGRRREAAEAHTGQLIRVPIRF